MKPYTVGETKTDCFQTNKTIYGNLQKDCYENKSCSCLLVEGTFDMISLVEKKNKPITVMLI